jgi:sulfite exporter TauE/SafE/plastocyanin domain-containing protein/copper chaperone CopZ
VNKKIVYIKDMHCRSCELLVEEALRKVKGIVKVKVSYKNSFAEIYSKKVIDDKIIYEAVLKAGYGVGKNETKPWINKNPNVYRDIFYSLAIVIVLFYAAKKFGLLNISFNQSANPSSLVAVLLVGITAGLSTCMAVVGGLVLGVSARHAENFPNQTIFQKFTPHLFFNLGRIVLFFFFGGLIGLIGKTFQLSGIVLGILIIIVGVVMLLLGVQLTEMFPKISNFSFTLPSKLSKLLGLNKSNSKKYTHINSFITGGLTFFLPCGFTQAMQLFAMTTGSFIAGGLIMATFALGTTPGLLSVSGLTVAVKGNFAKSFFKFTGVLIIFLAIFNISNGFNLTELGGVSGSSKSSIGYENNITASIEDGFQVIRMTQSSSGYSPNRFVIAKGIPAKWVIDAQAPNSCSSSIISSKLGIKKYLNPGENVIEFTPENTGEAKFSCLMGMYTGKFIIIDDNNLKSEAGVSDNSSTSTDSSDSSIAEDSTTSTSKDDQEETTSTTKENTTAVDTTATNNGGSQIQEIKTTYISSDKDISPNQFTVKVNKPVRFIIEVNETGQGCMSTILIPGLVNEPVFLEKGKTIIFEFTPTSKGSYNITCAMGVPRGILVVE